MQALCNLTATAAAGPCPLPSAGRVCFLSSVGETRVDLLHLLEDLRDAYPGALEETILTEVVANALDSGARFLTLATDPARATLTVIDDGSGMRRRELRRYHDIAASTKTRGQGIGFAGVGIKLGLLVGEEVVTETRHGSSHGATSWHLASRHRAPWRWIEPPGMLEGRGTAVRLRARNPLSPLLDPGFLDATLRRHYAPLLDPLFAPILAPHYPHGVVLAVNGRRLESDSGDASERAVIQVRLGRKRKPAALGYLARNAVPLPEDRRGVAVSTLGKVIRQGWDWLGVTPAAPEHVHGLVEAPALAECLTLNKADFVRVGSRGAVYLAHRKAIQEAVLRQLADWGDVRDRAEEVRQRMTRPLERELERVVVDLAADFPLLATLVAQRTGHQGRLPMGGGKTADGRALVLASATGGEAPPRAEPATPRTPREAAGLPGGGASPRLAHYGLGIQFEERPDDPEVGRLLESTVWVNAAHPAWRRAAASRSEGYHIALSAALALARLAVEPAQEHAFVTAFLARWGAALEDRGRRRLRGDAAS